MTSRRGTSTDQLHDLVSRVSGVESDIKNLSDAVHTLNGAIRNLSDRFSQSTKTDWPTLAAFATVMVTVIGGMGYAVIQPVKVELALVRGEYIRHKSMKGHLGALVEIDNLKEKVKAMESNRFTDADARYFEKRIDAIEEEQKRRTGRVYNRKVQ